jgi:hypothetical protein
MHTLSQILPPPGGTVGTEHQDRIRAISRGNFGKMVVTPTRLGQIDSAGRTTLVYEGDEARGGPKGRRHRAIVTITKGASASCYLCSQLTYLQRLQHRSS